MKKILTILLFVILSQISKAQLYFPPVSGNTWDTISPTSLGWCQDKIDTLIDFLDTKNTKAFIVLKDGKIVIE
ncbi:MAG: serine hydrolase, partial [Bacteroidota bacterium]